jgi:hypothetical protein
LGPVGAAATARDLTAAAARTPRPGAARTSATAADPWAIAPIGRAAGTGFPDHTSAPTGAAVTAGDVRNAVFIGAAAPTATATDDHAITESEWRGPHVRGAATTAGDPSSRPRPAAATAAVEPAGLAPVVAAFPAHEHLKRLAAGHRQDPSLDPAIPTGRGRSHESPGSTRAALRPTGPYRDRRYAGRNYERLRGTGVRKRTGRGPASHNAVGRQGC